jgi:hypothetical protein
MGNGEVVRQLDALTRAGGRSVMKHPRVGRASQSCALVEFSMQSTSA